MKKLGIGTTLKSLFKLLGLIKDRFLYTTAVILDVSVDLGFNLAFAYGSMYIISGLEQTSESTLVNGIMFLVVAAIGVMILGVSASYLINYAVVKISGRLRCQVFDHVCKLPVSWFEGRHSGDILSRLTNDMQATENAWGKQFTMPLGSILNGVGCAAFMIIIHWQMGLISIGIGVGMLYISSRFISPIKRHSDAVQSKLSITTQRLVDILASAKVARIFNLSGYLLGKLDEASGNVYKSEMRAKSWQAVQSGVSDIGSTMSFLGMVMIGGIYIAQGKLTFAELMAVSQLSNGIVYMFYILGDSLATLQQSLAGSDRVIEVLETEVEEQSINTTKMLDEAVSLKDVSFSYEEGTLILDQIQESIQAGETVALVGGSGGGKSTILKLIMGFYHPDEGAVTVQGEAPRDAIAYVPQTNYLFAGTIRENIAYGHPNATEEDVIAAAKAAMAHNFIVEMEDGYDTMVGERGSRLSGGQRQRIAIARAIVKNAPILLLDEATSSLDSESERMVQQAIDRLIEGRTSVIVAHRLSTIRHADRILVLEGGRVVEKGQHDELLKKEGRYAYYYNLQFDEQKAG